MKTLIVVLILATTAFAGPRTGYYGTGIRPSASVRPSVRSNGTYTRSYVRTPANSTKADNYRRSR